MKRWAGKTASKISHQMRRGVKNRMASRIALGGQKVEIGESAGVIRKPICDAA
jgi:hypothetical protein